jgi:hypothetical protein
MTLDQLVAQLKSAHGGALLGVVVYGSTATASAASNTAGHNVLIVVRTLDLKTLQAGGAIGRSWQEAGNEVPLTLTEAEWRSSADVFAIEHADIAERHRVAYAADGFRIPDAASVDRADIRRQLEYESLALVLAVRAGITSVGRDARAGRLLLAGQVGRAVALLRAGVRLSGAVPEADAEALCAQAGKLAGFAPAPIVAALRQKRGTSDVPKQEVESVLSDFHAALMQFVAYVDGSGRER